MQKFTKGVGEARIRQKTQDQCLRSAGEQLDLKTQACRLHFLCSGAPWNTRGKHNKGETPTCAPAALPKLCAQGGITKRENHALEKKCAGSP